MIESINVDKFRGIKHFSCSGLKRVNVFVGKNNCGKTSILEALFLLTGPANMQLILGVNQFRGMSDVLEEDLLKTIFYKLDGSKGFAISGIVNSEERKMRVCTFRSGSVQFERLDDESPVVTNKLKDKYYGLDTVFSIENNAVKYNLRLSVNSDKSFSIGNVDGYTESVYSKYVPSNLLSTPVDYLKKILIAKRESKILTCLQNIESNIKNIALVGNAVMVDLGFDKLLPINILGDGVRRLLSILVDIEECSGGVLLIDEIDNGFHYSSMKTLWQGIFDFAKQCNTQLFVTTHNIDSLRAMYCVLNEENNTSDRNNVNCIKLNHNGDGELFSVCYDFEQLGFVIEQEIEIR